MKVIFAFLFFFWYLTTYDITDTKRQIMPCFLCSALLLLLLLLWLTATIQLSPEPALLGLLGAFPKQSSNSWHPWLTDARRDEQSPKVPSMFCWGCKASAILMKGTVNLRLSLFFRVTAVELQAGIWCI